jgi:hypothetical protein
MGKGFTYDAIPALSACESPIEGKFIQALFDRMMEIESVFFSYFSDPSAKLLVAFGSETNHEAPVIRFYIQHKHPALNGGRVDLFVTMSAYGHKSELVVELDGIEFHSSPEQVKLDRFRDRRLLDSGVPVVRFTGSDVYSPLGARAAVDFVLEVAYSRLEQLRIIGDEKWNEGYERALNDEGRAA